MNSFYYLTAIGPILIVGVLIYIFWIKEKKRTKELSLLAASLKLNFSHKDNEGLFDKMNKFHLFSVGHSKRIKNLIEGDVNNAELSIFDYQYTTGGGQHSHTCRQSVFCIRSPKLCLPYFSMRPEGIFHKIGGAFGYQDIDFKSHPEFSKKYLLRGENEESIRQLFNKNLLKNIESQQKISIEGGGNQLAFYRHKKRIKPDDIESFMDEGFCFFKLFLEAT